MLGPSSARSAPRRRTNRNQSPIDRRHTGWVVAIARRSRNLALDPIEVWLRQRHVHRGEVLLEVFAALRARDWNDVVALGQDPRERELTRGAPFLVRKLLDLCDDPEVVLQVLALPAGISTAPV